MSRHSIVAAACIPAAIVLYVGVVALPAESHNVWGGVAFAGLLAVIVMGIASAVLARRHR